MTRIVILSYGLQRRTREALERARRYGHQIHLVPAIPMASQGLRRHRSSLVTVHDEVGRSGLAAALGPDDETVLLLHEDVMLHADAADELLTVAEQRGTVVVPRTNHTDVDNPTGELPPDVVQRPGEPLPPVEVRRFRSVCMAGPASRFRGMLRHRITAATTRLAVGESSALQLPHVLATHLDEGRDQLEDPTGPGGRPLLAAAMIVKNEEDFLEGCLASLDGLVDRIVVCDTGSTDNTVEIARAAGAEVIEVAWRNDFAWARNQALERCRDAWWVLHVDADERVVVDDPVEVRRVLATALPDRDGFDVPLEDIAEDGSRLGGQQLPRLFPAENTTYVGRVHEIPRYSDGSLLPWTVTELLEIEHLGYQASVIEGRDKLARNLRLARADYEESPTPIAMLQLARSLKLSDDTIEELLDVLGRLHDLMLAGEDGLNEVGHIPVYQLYSQALLRHGQEDRAWEVIQTGYERYPHAPVLRATAAEIGMATGRYDAVSSLTASTDDAGERPWRSPVADAAARLRVALSRLALDDIDGAGEEIVDLLEAGVPSTLGRWGEIVSIVALSRPEQVVELLLPAAAADQTGQAIDAVALTFEPSDAARFAAQVLDAAPDVTDEQVDAALRIAAANDEPEVVVDISVTARLTSAALAARLGAAGPRVSRWLREEHLQDEPPANEAAVDAAISSLRDLASTGPDDESVISAAGVLVRDVSGEGIRRLGRELPPAVAAHAAVATVLHGPAPAADVRTALALCALADDGPSASRLAEHVGRVNEDVLTTLLERAEQRGALSMVAALRTMLVSRDD